MDKDRTIKNNNTAEALSRVIFAIMTRIFLSQRVNDVESFLTVAQRKVLLCLDIHGPISMTQIARQEGITLPAATVLMERLVKLGYVERISDPKDRRLVLIILTHEGKSITENLKQRYMNRLQEILDEDLSNPDREALMQSLNTMADIFQRIPSLSKRPDVVAKSIHAGGRKPTRFKGDSKLKQTEENLTNKGTKLGMFVAMLTTATLFVTGCSNNSTTGMDAIKEKDSVTEIVEVHLLKTEERTIPEKISVVGSLAADAASDVASRVAGLVLERKVERGDYVTTGQVMVTLDPSVIQISLDKAESVMKKLEDRLGVTSVEIDFDPDTLPEVKSTIAEMELAKTTHERNVALRATNTISQADVDKSYTANETAKQRYLLARRVALDLFNDYVSTSFTVKDLKRQLNDMIIKAPFAGLVADHKIEAGEYVKEGDEVVRLLDVDPIHLRITVPENLVRQIKQGQGVEFALPGEKEFSNKATITYINPNIDPESRALSLDALAPNAQNIYKPGYFVKANIIKDPNTKAILLPEKSIKRISDATYVLIAQDGIAHENVVRVGDTSKGITEIREGLKSGVDVILEADKAFEGAKLTVSKDPLTSETAELVDAITNSAL